jgi:CBS domain-containing protein
MTDAGAAGRVLATLERTPPFDGLDAAARDDLLADVLVDSFEPGDVVLAQNADAHAYLYVVTAGHVRLADAQTGRLIDDCAEGDTFGSYGLLRGGPRPYEARAVEPTTCALVPAATFHRLHRDADAFAAFFDADLGRYTTTLRTPIDVAGSRLLFQTRLGDLVGRAPVVCAPDLSVRAAARQMREAHVGSIVVVDGERPLGIVTNTDLRDRVVVEGTDPKTPVEQVMSAPVIGSPADAFVFEGLMTLVRHRMHHLVVTDGERLVGVLSDQDLVRAQGHNPASLAKQIERAERIDDLLGVRTELGGHLVQLARQGVRGEDLVAVNTAVNDRLAVRVLALAEAAVRAEGDAVDLPWVWLALGSEGREEMSLKTDQDNAILYADPGSPEEAERAARFFERLADRANRDLAAVGFDLCPGEVMARNPKWRLSLTDWKRTFRRWIVEPDERAGMHTTIFFDLRGLYGALPLARSLTDAVRRFLGAEPGFLPFLMRDALDTRVPLSFFRRFVVERSGAHSGTLDLKHRGLAPVVDLARVLALDAGYFDSTNTLDRLAHVRDALPGIAASADDARDAYRFILDLRLDHQLRAVEAGQAPDNFVPPESLSKVQQTMLKAAFSAIGDLQEVLAHRYGAGLMR